MKKRILCAIMVLAMFMSFMMFVGCESKENQANSQENSDDVSPNQEGSNQGEGKKVALSFATNTIELWVRLQEQLVEKLTDGGYEVVATQIADDDANKQLEQCVNMLTLEPDILILAAVDSASSAQIVDHYEEAGVPVLAVQRMCGGNPVAYCADDNYALGPVLAQYVLDNVPSGNIMMITGDPLDTNAGIFRDTCMEVLQPYIDEGRYKVICDQYIEGWSPEGAMSVVENALTANNNDVAAVICTNDGMAGGAIEALSGQGLAGSVVVTGGDCELAAALRIKEGTQSMTLLKNPYTISDKDVELIKMILNGEKLPEPDELRNNGTMDVPCYFVDMDMFTKDNVSDLVEMGVYTKDELGVK